MTNIVSRAFAKLAGPAYRIMYDGINVDAEAIWQHNHNPALVAGYDTGGWPWSPQEWGLFPHSVRVQIVTTSAANEGDVLDVESGDATPSEAVGWVQMRRKAGYFRPTVYIQASNVPQLMADMTHAGEVLGGTYHIWVADWNGTPTNFWYCVAHQFSNQPWADISAVFLPTWPERTAPTKPTPPPPHKPAAVHRVSTGAASLDAVMAARYKIAPTAPGAAGPVENPDYPLELAAAVAKVVALSLQLEKPRNAAKFRAYVSGGTDKPMPKGLVYYTEH